MKSFSLVGVFFAASVAALWSGPAVAADSAGPYPGTLTVKVDMTQAARKLYLVHETVPVKPGALTLYYPKWLPGYHSPSGPILDVAGLVFKADGKRLPWRRDLADMYAIHLTIPAGVSTLNIAFDVLSATHNRGLGDGDLSQSPDISDLQWNQVVFYPAGYASKAIKLRPSVALPKGWHFASALVPHTGTGGGEAKWIRFAPVTLNNLVDSPVVSGRYFRQVDLAPGAEAPVMLDMVADAPADLAITPKQIEDFRRLVTQENRMFGAHHYGSYHMLLTLSDHISGLALEHHQSFDIRTDADFLTDPQAFLTGATDVPHEYTHSWNGKYRRPYDLWTPDFNSVPMKGDLLWVYEGLTQYWATVMAARAGFRTPAEFRQALAMTAAAMDHEAGRTWRSLQDVADMASMLYYVPSGWHNWRRGTDFYPEGVLLWLDVDTKIRELSHDRRSLNDFARLFYGMDNGSYITKTYTFDDVVNALNQVQPYDWAAFLHHVLNTHRYHAPLAGIARGGYKLVYTGTPSKMWKAGAGAGVNAMYSAGFKVNGQGEVTDVLWNGPAFKAGLIPGMQITAVDRKSFSPDVLKDVIGTARGSKAPITLLVKNAGQYETLQVDYHGGLRYPHLERVKGMPDYLDRIVVPLR
ncbi:MAG TPA: M61 family peptidase [Gammaproteobacteria bacterium]|nr:M61 family peptidase [Gammaproteobacteria bacterium]